MPIPTDHISSSYMRSNFTWDGILGSGQVYAWVRVVEKQAGGLLCVGEEKAYRSFTIPSTFIALRISSTLGYYRYA
jgi:hypothetical protein